MTQLDVPLVPYRVTLHEESGDRFQLVFDCMAEDDDHAATQAEKAYQGCEIVHTMRLEFYDALMGKEKERKCK